MSTVTRLRAQLLEGFDFARDMGFSEATAKDYAPIRVRQNSGWAMPYLKAELAAALEERKNGGEVL